MIRNRPGAATPALLPRAGVRPLALTVLTLIAGASLPALAQNGSAASSSSSSAPAHVHKKAAGASTSGAQDERAATSYSIGLLQGMQLHQLGLTPESISYTEYVKGLRAAMAGTAKPTPQDQQRAVAFVQHERAAQVAKNEEAARKFLAENAKAPGVQTTSSGLEYKVIKPGSGESPKLTDEVVVNYRGTLLNGSEFDSSYSRGKPTSFPLGTVIKGWQEALLLMKPGAEYEFWIPPDLGYGANSPPPIPPGSLLKFNVVLLSAKPAQAAAAPRMPAPGATHPGAAGEGGGAAPK
ncbi:MAG TPA: FKBP-type peptidyl-prolyl cis-trans isomerase [Steroidobacteraceae bacterium]|nr:FKBP-type peptidyl-prolyl cis-trans isomerase [Steroidobacteraceae bacterium]